MSIHQGTLVSIDEKDTQTGGKLRKMAVFLMLSFGLAVLAFQGSASAAAPTVSRISPTSGPLSGSQTAVITGSGFTGATAVAFGSTSATDFAVVSDKQIVVAVPAATAGKVTILVTVGGDTNTTGGSYTYLAPVISSISPGYASDAAASIVTISGKGLLGTLASEVVFTDGTDDFAATDIWVISDTQIVVETPIDVANTATPPADNSVDVPSGVLDVEITRNSVATTPDSKSKFLITTGIPTITDLTDGSSSVTGTDGVDVGETLTITGTRLWGVSQVNFGSRKVTTGITINTAGTSLTVDVPSQSSAPVNVSVTNAAGTSDPGLKTAFNYLSTKAPTVTAAYPSAIDKSKANSVLITGRGLTGVALSNLTLTCGGSTVTITSATTVSDTSLILVLPTQTSAAACDLVIANPTDSNLTGTLSGGINYL